MIRREWWISRIHNWDVGLRGQFQDLGPVSELWAVELDGDRILRAWGPLDSWKGHGEPPTEPKPIEKVRVRLPRRMDCHGIRLDAAGQVVPLRRVLTAAYAVVSSLEERRKAGHLEPLKKRHLKQGRSGVTLRRVS